jgi:hypothetical protein
MQTNTHRRTPIIAAAALAAAMSFAAPRHADAFNDRYVFAATRGVSSMRMHPALKATLFPVTVAVDLAFLPFSTVAGLVT